MDQAASTVTYYQDGSTIVVVYMPSTSAGPTLGQTIAVGQDVSGAAATMPTTTEWKAGRLVTAAGLLIAGLVACLMVAW